MRSTGTSDDFIPGRNAELVHFTLDLTSDNKVAKTEFYFNANTSEGFDIGYDAAVWGGSIADFGIYSHLVQDNEGRQIALQTMNASSLTDVTIPLGINANQGEQIRISISESTLSASVNIYLDDVMANTSTLLNDGDYVFTPNTDLSGTGRFFLRTSEDALSTIENSLNSLNIFALNNSKELVVSGQVESDSKLVIYDIQGRKVFNLLLDDSQIENRIDTSNITSGVYLVTVSNNNESITKKVILK